MANFTAVVIKVGEWWIGWIEEVPGVNAQEKTKNELLVSLKEALRDILELRRGTKKSHIEFLRNFFCNCLLHVVDRESP